jgi:predicted ATPase
MIQSLAQERQIIVATQSPLMVDTFGLEQLFVLEMIEGRTELHAQNVQELQGWLDDFSVGELWQKNLLGGRP